MIFLFVCFAYRSNLAAHCIIYLQYNTGISVTVYPKERLKSLHDLPTRDRAMLTVNRCLTAETATPGKWKLQRTSHALA